MDRIEPGIILELIENVTEDLSAATIGSGALDVYSTPSMIAFMEKTSMRCIEPRLKDNETTVGGAVNIRHYKPTAIGKRVVCKSEVRAVKGNKIDLHVEVFENGKLIGDGQHTRFIVDKDSFMKNI